MVKPGMKPVQATAALVFFLPAMFMMCVARLSAPPLRSMHTAIAAPKMMMKEMPPSVLPKPVFMASITLPNGSPVPNTASAMVTANSAPKTLNLTLAVK